MRGSLRLNALTSLRLKRFGRHEFNLGADMLEHQISGVVILFFQGRCDRNRGPHLPSVPEAKQSQ